MFHVLKNRSYRRLYLAQIVALLGTGLATLALGLLAYTIAEEHAGRVLGTALAIKMVAYVFLGPIANAVVTYLPRKFVLVSSDLVRMMVAAFLPFVTDIWQIYLLIFVLQAASATFTPTFQSLIPEVLPDEDDYTMALSLSRLAYDLEAVVSPVLASVLLLALPSSTLFFGTAFGFASSALLVLSCGYAASTPQRSDQSPDFFQRIARGILLVFRTPHLRPIVALNMAVASVGAFVIVQTVVIVQLLWHMPEYVVAIVLGMNGAGSMASALLLPSLLKRVSERTVMLGGGLALVGTAIAIVPVLSLAPRGVAIIITMVQWVVIGGAWSCVETPVGRRIRRYVDTCDLSSVFAAQFSLQHACWLLSYPLAGWLGAYWLIPSAGVLACISAVSVCVAYFLWPLALDQKFVVSFDKKPRENS
ncbi:MAG: MFS transporter [Actinomycetaceae bacterium]|nr:MFS transporter [Actinomycetaceae bacterium]